MLITKFLKSATGIGIRHKNKHTNEFFKRSIDPFIDGEKGTHNFPVNFLKYPGKFLSKTVTDSFAPS